MKFTHQISSLKKFILDNVIIQKIIVLLMFQYILAAFLYILSAFLTNHDPHKSVTVVHTIDGGVTINYNSPKINFFSIFYSPFNPNYHNLLRFYDIILLFNISSDQPILIFFSIINYLMWLIYLISDNLKVFHRMYIFSILYSFISYTTCIYFFLPHGGVGFIPFGTCFFLTFPYEVMKKHLHVL